MPTTIMTYRSFSNQSEPELQKINDELERIEESILVTDGCRVDILGTVEKIEDRLEGLEEGVKTLKVENIELKNHLNSVIKELNSTIQELNAVTEVLNNRYGDVMEKRKELNK